MKMNERGIMLITVIITVIVLVILAGVAISTLIGNDGLLKNAENAVGRYNEKSTEEADILNSFEETLNEYVGTIIEDYDPANLKVDENGLATANVRIKPSENNPDNMQIIIPKGFAPAILQTGTLQSLPGEDGSVKEKMLASQWNNITATDINKGIVVVDADGNEFVWIPITNTSKFGRVAWTTAYGYDKSGTYKEGTCTTPQQFSDISTANRWWEDKSSTNTEYTNMVTSITQSKGFYVARYEASSNNGSTKAQSKRGVATWTNIKQTDAITKSANYNTTLHSHLMYGIEWDSILNWLNGNAMISSSTSGKTKTMELSDLQTNSCSWGNYQNSTGDATTNKGPKQTTGKSEYWKANNIYDLAGNVYEWTQEKYSTGSSRAFRGGEGSFDGDCYPASVRSCDGYGSMYGGVGFRVSFYL